MNFAKNLQSIRKGANLSQEQLAEQLHISRQAISKWEMGQSTPDIDTCVRLCEVLKVTPNRLLLGADEDGKIASPVKKDSLITIFVIASIFLMVVCACGTIMLICNLYNGEIFEGVIHDLSFNMIRGSLLAFAVMFGAILLYRFRKNHHVRIK